MSKDNLTEVLENFNPEKKKNPILCFGVDCGTMFIAAARSDSDDVKIIRNAYLSLDKEEISLNDLTDINYVESDSGELYIIGEDAFKLANLFNKQISRPMERGMISPKEVNAIDILTLMIKSLLGDIKDKDVYCSYSVPAEAIDENRSVIYHEKVFSKIFNSLGVNNTSVNEAMAIIYSEASKEKFTGVGISFGAGMVNCAIAYHGIEALKFSTARSGDWIDKSVAESLNTVQNRVTSTKEKFLSLEEGIPKETDKKKARVLEALNFYYESLINYTIKKIIKEFEDKVEIEIDEPVNIIISGGTSLPPGFVSLFKSVISKYTLPFEIAEIRHAKNPLTAVAKGLLVKTMSDVGDKK